MAGSGLHRPGWRTILPPPLSYSAIETVMANTPRFVAPLDPQTVHRLKNTMRTSPVFRVRQRAHAILLSAKAYRIDQLIDIFEVDRDTITRWLDRWDEDRFEGLEDAPRSGRPHSIPVEEEPSVLKQVEDNPRQLKAVVARLEDRFSVSLATIKRLLKRHGYKWRRVRRSLKSKRDEAAFRKAQAELDELKVREDRGELELYYFDGSGFSLTPVVPYAWQAPGQTIEIDSARSAQINVLGFLRRSEAFEPFVVEGSVCSETVVACIDAFCARLEPLRPGKVRVLVLDRASVHTSKRFHEASARWRKQGLQVKYLPSYSPELNLIELLWQAIKYRWLPFSAYESVRALREALEEILLGIGTKYRITFA